MQKILMSLLLLCCSTASLASEHKRPNVVFIMSDQQHYQAMGNVDNFFQTPHIDALSKESVVFEHAFVTTPQCSPSRASMMTGLYPHKTGMMNNVGSAGGTELALPTIGKRMQDAGYVTGFMGKWHLGDNEIGNAGWDVRSGSENRSGDGAEGGTDEADLKLALSFMDDHAGGDKPLFMFMMFNDPHDIYHFQNRPNRDPAKVKEAVLGKSWYQENLAAKPAPQLAFMKKNQGMIIHGKEKAEWQYYRDYYRQKVTLFDDMLGRVITKLKAQDMWNNTIIVFSSDHGDMDTYHKLIFKGPFMYEHMIRVPALIRVPTQLGGVTPYVEDKHDWLNVDLLPTVLDLVGLDIPQVDGISYKPLLTNGEQGKSREFVVTQYYGKQQWVSPIRSIRNHQFKYNLYLEYGEELYDLKNDPQEIVNLAKDAKFATVKAGLKGQLDKWMKENNDEFYSYQVTEMQSSGPVMKH